MRGWTAGEDAGTASAVEADIGGGLAAGDHLVAFVITNKSTTTDLVLKWGATGEERTIAASPSGDLTWAEPMPPNGRLVVTSANIPRAKTGSGTADYLARWYHHEAI